MTTHRDDYVRERTSGRSLIEPYWFGRTGQEIRDTVAARGVAWGRVPGYSRYEWGDKDNLVRRVSDGYPMKTDKLNNAGYPVLNVIRDDKKPVTVTVHSMVLLAHHPAFAGLATFPDGLETRHNPQVGDKTFNAYPEGLWPGTKKANAGDKDGQEPQFECRNYVTCGNMVHNQGRRCVSCTEAVGREAATLLNAGANLMTVADRFGYTGPDWVWKLAVKYGAYEGTKAEALAQHPTVTQRIRLRARTRRSDAL